MDEAALTLEQQQALARARARLRLQQANESTPERRVEPSTALERAGAGVMDPIHGGAQLLEQAVTRYAPGVAGGVRNVNNWLAEKTGLVAPIPEGGVNQMVVDRERDYQARRAAAGSEGVDWARMAGNVASPVNAGLAWGPGFAAGLGTRMAVGAGTGALQASLQPVTQGDFWGEKGKQVALGGAVGGAAPAVMAGAARVVRPQTNPEVNALTREGIRTTPGQILGGALKTTEEKATSLPILGDAIRAAQRRGIEDFNRATYRRALEPLGPEAAQVAENAPVGNQGIRAVGDYLSSQYDTALDRSVPNVVSRDFVGRIDSLRSMVPTALQDDFKNILRESIWGKVTPAGTLTPSVAKQAESTLGQRAAGYIGSSTESERQLGRALRQAQTELRELVAQNNPEVAPLIQKINAGWSDLVQIENAGGMLGAKNGIFTPSQYLNAIKKGDASVRDRRFTRNEVNNVDFARAADNVLSQRYPDSGTAGRGFLGLLAGGLGGATAPGATLGTIAGLSAASRPYLAPANALVRGALTARPESANLLADLVRGSGNYLAPAGIAALENR